MDKGGYLQPATQDLDQESMRPADLDKWAEANRDIWKLVRIAGVPLAQAKDLIIGNWDLSEKNRFEAWVNFYESEDDKKYKGASYTDCDFETVKLAAINIAGRLATKRGSAFTDRINQTGNVQTIIDYIRAMSNDVPISKTAAEEDEIRSSSMFHIIRVVQDELSKKKLVRNLAKVLSMDRDGMYPEVPQALAKLIEAYNYATTRVQDVMGRLGLQLSINKGEPEEAEEGEVKEKPKGIPVPKEVRKEPSPRPAAAAIEPTRETKELKPAPRPAPRKEEEEGEPMLPRVRNRGI